MTYTTPSGEAPRLCFDILRQPHTLIAGATGSGKSVMLNSVVCAALLYPPTTAEMILIDPKRVELIDYADTPHCIRYASEADEIRAALAGAVDLMERRYKQLRRERVKKWSGAAVYVVIDELADLMTTDRAGTLSHLQRLAQLGRAAGIHLLLATQRPTRDVIDGRIMVNVDARLALRCPTAQDSRNIVHAPGAELLPRYGHGYYLTPDTMLPVLVTVPMLAEDEIRARVKWWTAQKRRRWWSA